MRLSAALLALAALTLSPVLRAADPPPEFARYLPLYPGLYGQLAYGAGKRDSSYTQTGQHSDSAAPQTTGGSSAFPEQSLTARFTWYFPLFEGRNFPYFSQRLHLARVVLRQQHSHTRGALNTFINNTADDASTDADNLRSAGNGLGDPSFEFGSFLLGSPDWRKGERKPYALLGLVGFTYPGGVYERDAPVSAGSNTISLYGTLGGHWQPWRGGFVDAGYTYRKYYQNYDAAFGALDPTNQGSDQVLDLSLAQRLPWGLYLTAFGSDRHGAKNTYKNPRFAPNKPAAPNTVPASNNYPTRGTYFDGGTALTEAGLSLHWFARQRLQLGLHYVMPQSGKSGQFLLPYTNRQPANCTPGGLGCSTSAGQTVLVDGTGAARSYASERLALTISYQFGLGDPYTCPGCKK